MKGRVPLILAGILLVGLALRLYHLGTYAFWYDEAYSMIESQKLSEILNGQSLGSDSPLYILVLHFWRMAAGTPFTLRLLSVIFGLLAVWGTYLLAARLVSKPAGLAAAALAAVSPFMVHYSQELRTYGLMAAVAAAAMAFTWKALNEGGAGRWIGFVIAFSLLIYTHYFGLFFVAAANIYFFAIGLRSLGKWKPWITANVIIVLLYLPWLGVLLEKAATTATHYDATQPLTLASSLLTAKIILLGHHKAAWFAVALFAAAASALIVIGMRSLSGTRGVRSFLVLFAVVPFAAAAAAEAAGLHVFVHRYFIASLVPMIVIMAAGWVAMRAAARVAVVALVLVPFALSLFALYANGEMHEIMISRKQPYDRMMAFVEGHWRNGDLVLHLDKSSYAPMWYYSKPEHRGAHRLSNAQWEPGAVIPPRPQLERGVGMVPRSFDLAVRRDNGVWLVTSYWGKWRFENVAAVRDGRSRLDACLRGGGWRKDPKVRTFGAEGFDWVEISYWRRDGLQMNVVGAGDKG